MDRSKVSCFGPFNGGSSMQKITLSDSSQDVWQECEPGTLGRYAVRAQSRILVRRITKGVGIATLCLMAVFAWTAYGPQINAGAEPNYGGIVCSKVKSDSKSYLAGTLDPNTNAKIDLHLKHCPRCLAWMNQLRSAQANNGSPIAGRFVSMRTAP
jgi:hypothetical protein